MGPIALRARIQENGCQGADTLTCRRVHSLPGGFMRFGIVWRLGGWGEA